MSDSKIVEVHGVCVCVCVCVCVSWKENQLTLL
jgi:hypothetical protein